MRRLVTLAGLIGFTILLSIPSPSYAQQRPAPKYVMRGDDTTALVVTEYSPPAIYSKWWDEIADCEGLRLPTDAEKRSVQWFSVPAMLFSDDGTPANIINGALAGTFSSEHVIYVGQPYVWEEQVVKHEMLHVLLWDAGFVFRNFHPKELFEICGIHVAYPIHR